MAGSKEMDEFEYQLQAQQHSTQETPSSTETQTYTDPNDGTVYEWDSQRRGWFPKVNDQYSIGSWLRIFVSVWCRLMEAS